MDRHRLLLPLAVVQGLWVLGRTPRLPVPPGSSGRFGPGNDPLEVVGVGDSIMAGTGVREQCCSLTATFARLLHERTGRSVAWQAHGRNGATTGAVLNELAPAAKPAHVYLVSCGVNDATRGVGVEEFTTHLAGLLGLLRKKSPHATIFYGGLPPLDCFPALPWPLKSILAARVARMQAAAHAVIARAERTLCFRFPESMPAEQFASDGFHPAEYACERWASGLLDLWPGDAIAAAEPALTRRASNRRRADRRAAAGPGSPWPRASRS